LPHIGTVCEVLRVGFVRKAFERLGQASTKLFVVSDDLDALRKIPTTFPRHEELHKYLGLPLCRIRDPFGHHASLSEGINQRLIRELAVHQLDYEFVRSSDSYAKGEYNETLRRFLSHYKALNEVVASRLGPVRRASYNIFMPISPFTGRVIEHIRILETDESRGHLTYEIPRNVLVQRPGDEYSVTSEEYYPQEPLDRPVTISVLDGHCKLQWKADWAMRLIARNISFEMHGEDLIDSARTVQDICAVLGHEPPLLFQYGLFSDDHGRKISKTKGNGFSLEHVNKYIPPGGLQHFVFTAPQRPSRFHAGLSPSIVDKWRQDVRAYALQPDNPKSVNPVHYFPREPLLEKNTSSYRKVLRIIDACAANDDFLIQSYLGRYGIDASGLELSRGGYLSYVVAYYRDVVLPTKRCVKPFPHERSVLTLLTELLEAAHSQSPTVADIQWLLQDAWQSCKELGSIYDLYLMVYRCVLGQPSGPKLARYIWLCGARRFADLIRQRLNATAISNDHTPAHVPEIHLPPASTGSLPTTPIVELPMRSLRPVSFAAVQRTTAAFVDHLSRHSNEIARSLSGFECFNVAEDEVRRCTELLNNIELNKEYFQFAVRGVTAFLPLNQPLYATVCFGAVPSLMADEVWVRPPTAMQAHYRLLVEALDLERHFPNLHVSYEEKDEFLARRAPVTDAVIFTGTPENALKVHSKFLKRALFILNGAGHNPLVVSASADTRQAVDSALRVVLYNQGQDCAGPNAILVHEARYQEFVSTLRRELEDIAHLVGPYEQPQNIVGPNSDPDHAVKISRIFREARAYCTYGGEINPVTGLIRPTIFEKALSHGGNYREFFAPVFFIQRYERDEELALYFNNPQYHPNAMYISLFGDSVYVRRLIDEGRQPIETVLHGVDLHQTEKGYLPYGGMGPTASCLFVNGERKLGATLPQRDIYRHLVAPFATEAERVEV
jgi:lysyl-tRNA synthetase, class I